jgi:hypothetical protein
MDFLDYGHGVGVDIPIIGHLGIGGGGGSRVKESEFSGTDSRVHGSQHNLAEVSEFNKNSESETFERDRASTSHGVAGFGALESVVGHHGGIHLIG